MGPSNKKKNDDWLNGAIPVSEDEWLSQAVPVTDEEWNQIANSGPNADLVNDSEDAPALIRAEVGALEKPEDRLKALRKHFPDAQYDPEDPTNFVYTDQKGVVRRYNQPNWLPFNLGDLASIAPEVGETVGGILGAGGGALLGGFAGSAVPVAGTGAGALTGGIAGAGAGAVAGRETTQWGLNKIFGNEDTRTDTERAIDASQTFALGAGGQALGPLVLRPAGRAIKTAIIGGKAVDDAATIAQRANDFRSIGVEPTVGMVSGSERQATLEHALKSTRAGEHIEGRIKDAFAKTGDEFDRIASDMNGGKPAMSRAELGSALKDQAQAAKDAGFARSEQLYDEVTAKITATPTASNTAKFVADLQAEKAALSNTGKRIHEKSIDRVIEEAVPLIEDAKNGVSNFQELKEFRTYIGGLANDPNVDKSLKPRLNGLYRSLTADMEETALASGDDAAQAWRKANNQFRRLQDANTGFGKGGLAAKLVDPKTDSDAIRDLVFKNMAKGGNQIAAARRAIMRAEGGKETWDDVAGSIVDRLGKKTLEGGEQVFDTTTFLKNWKDEAFSKEAKDSLFKGTKHQQYREDLDKLSRIAGNLQRYQKADNHSNTAKHLTALGSLNPFSKGNIYATALGSAFSTGSLTAGAGVAAGKLAQAGAAHSLKSYRADLLTSPEVVNWLANVPKAEMQKGGLKAHFKKLVSIRDRAQKGTATAINEFLREMRYDEIENNE
ncbi:hypothetical protein [Sinorhizobium meliloti]|uniref:hypothetical protein n=1 Tax=Rhizobium meliloti TaxID=382 RepID=UPI00299EDF02|nr:hypothetical protein [Sinorhizobium meliloti]MDW9991046.1 hypothetical protein [Sinorhizobium meliloti]MDX0245446.1 hypothetical protein [Sinorhizobium meliloti]MDX0401550.1 hypothetical protein [Sinorhizobium meliloti]